MRLYHSTEYGCSVHSLSVVFVMTVMQDCMTVLNPQPCNARVVGSIPTVDQYENVCTHYCKSLCISASAK